MQISIIIPTYNSSGTIKLSLNSAICQTLQPYEIIVIDDCSKDNTKAICQELLSRTGIKYKVISTPKQSGPSLARNMGWSLASGDWIAFLDADDIWSDLKLEVASKFINNETSLLAHHYSEKKLSNSKINLDAIEEKVVTYRRSLFANRFSTPAVILSSRLEDRFNEDIMYGEDWELWLRILHGHGSVKKINANLAWGLKYAYGEKGLTKDLYKMKEGVSRVLKIQYLENKIGFFLYVILIIYHFLKGIRRDIIIFFR